MESYVVMYKTGMSLFANHATITGKNAQDALQKAFGKQFEYVTGDRAAYSDVILVKGTFEDNTVRYKGHYRRLCYIERRNEQ